MTGRSLDITTGSDTVEAVTVVFAVLLGACFASFFGVVAERVPRRQSLNGRSLCACGRTLGPGELIPVLSYLRVRGVARCCATRIPRRLVVGEVCVATTSAVGAALWGAPGALVIGGMSLVVFTVVSWGR